jgi:hypothetical protein
MLLCAEDVLRQLLPSSLSFFYFQAGVYISVRKRYLSPPPSKNYIFFFTPIVAFLP